MKKEFFMFGFAIFLFMSTIIYCEEPITYAERLGWEKGSRVIIFHIDDVGLCHGANQATIESFTKGVATSCSIMMPCAWVDEFVKEWKKNPQWDAGLHLTLTSEWDNYRWSPVSGFQQVLGLVDESGYMWGDVADVVVHAKPEEVDREIRAQLALAERMGIKPTHLDTHMGTLFATPGFTEKYINLGIEKQIPVLFPGGHMQYLQQELPFTQDYVKNWAQKIWDAGLPVLDDVITFAYDWKVEDKLDQMKKTLHEMKPGVTEVILHCAIPTEEFPFFTQSAVTRKGDYLLMINPELKKFLDDEKIILSTWRELKERRAKAK
ncbi:MAG TPA: polysaccharide deacetylase family protein [Candidatus Hydrogenedens sp.]|nr:polysaccharide deacetylase family protein [Candidatus Hydrogenedens sp.]HOK09538.1 polysaccharide deacetylase family protein [Candidatus Hydrogenedens sp.]HOL19185.1 polysaccharide deacetylase family protein [Candidatus Hydrogenedens sp.]HPP58401.1 polysaccharide deacetylase family protein [Candidatus Hydrogenedens sp.]